MLLLQKSRLEGKLCEWCLSPSAGEGGGGAENIPRSGREVWPFHDVGVQGSPSSPEVALAKTEGWLGARGSGEWASMLGSEDAGPFSMSGPCWEGGMRRAVPPGQGRGGERAALLLDTDRTGEKDPTRTQSNSSSLASIPQEGMWKVKVN